MSTTHLRLQTVGIMGLGPIGATRGEMSGLYELHGLGWTVKSRRPLITPNCIRRFLVQNAKR